jgi:hypothetical protein
MQDFFPNLVLLQPFSALKDPSAHYTVVGGGLFSKVASQSLLRFFSEDETVTP